MSSLYDWSRTAATNATADSLINWAEGQDPGSVNDSARQVMGRIAELRDDITGTITAGGTANALTVTAFSSFTTLANGRMVAFIAASDNTAAATLNVNGIGAKSIRKTNTTGDVPLVGAEIQAGGVYLVAYNTALNGAAGGWLLVNPTPINSMTLATSVAASGATVDFTGLPVGIKRLTIGLQNITTASTGVLAVQLGDSGGIEASGYSSETFQFQVGVPTFQATIGTTGFLVSAGGGGSSIVYNGTFTITRQSLASSTWLAHSTIYMSNDNGAFCAGYKATSAELDRVRLTANGDTFSLGVVSLMYEL
jgi:hypothetical protein